MATYHDLRLNSGLSKLGHIQHENRRGMTFDLAVWAGERPMSDAHASDTYESLMDRMEAGEFVECCEVFGRG